MKSFLARVMALLTIVAMAALRSAAQVPARSPSAPQTTSRPAAQNQQPGQQPAGQVIFSRSIGPNGQTVTTAGPPLPQSGAQTVATSPATDAERRAVLFTAYDMDVHLRTATQTLAARALVTVRNGSQTPLPLIPLQISSSLDWGRIRVGFHDVSYPVVTLNSDADHTGQLHEAAVPLAQPLQPGQSIQLDVMYSGTITPTAKRLLAIGTPPDVARYSDWDGIGAQFTGLRGFGNVVWYPVSSVPAFLGQGARLFDEIGKQKLHLAGTHFKLRLTVEFPNGQAPTVALVDGHPVPLTVTGGSGQVPGVATASLRDSTLGFQTPSLFVAVRSAMQAPNTALWVLPSDVAAVPAWAAAATAVTPFLQGWLGVRPRTQLTILDLPDPQDLPFETGALLVTSVRQAAPDELDNVMAHALTHAWIQSPSAWLSEGVAHFMGTLWLEKQQGRKLALESLANFRSALALAEPSSPGQSTGQPLTQAYTPIYYRTKAAFVLWMLRDIVGDSSLSAALRAYNLAEETATDLSQTPDGDAAAFEKYVQQASQRQSLSWLFADWVNADKGLPDLKINSVYPDPLDHGNWLVAVNISNSGYAAAEVPVTVETADTSVTQPVLVPANGRIVRRILIQGRPTQVRVNDGTVPETEASIHIFNLPPPVSPPPATPLPSGNPPGAVSQ